MIIKGLTFLLNLTNEPNLAWPNLTYYNYKGPHIFVKLNKWT
jgi:hypothetical protein